MCHRSSLFAVLSLAVAFATAAPAGAGVLIEIDKSAQQMTVSVDGQPRWRWPVSTGRLGYDTPSGSFRTFRMEKDHFSREWDDAPMPHSIFFTKRGHAIHGYLNTRDIGRPASHGCVRLEPENAAKLFALVKQEGVLNTTVVLTGSVAVAMRRQPAAAPRRATAARIAPPLAPEPAELPPPPTLPSEDVARADPPRASFPLFGLFAPRRLQPPAEVEQPTGAPPRLYRRQWP